jgi:hypothetical protein
MFTGLLRRIPDLEPSGPTQWLRTDAPIAPTVVGPKAMPVRFTPDGPHPKRRRSTSNRRPPWAVDVGSIRGG